MIYSDFRGIPNNVTFVLNRQVNFYGRSFNNQNIDFF
jgi:hypothetical protein